jgi:hypothetical protein
MKRLALPANPAARAVLAAVAVLLAINLVAAAIDALAPSPSGPHSSSFATSPRGLAAWAELERRAGVKVSALRRPPSATSLPAGGTVVLLDPGRLQRSEAEALRGFAERGGHVVAGGRPDAWVATLLGLDDPPDFDRDAPETAGRLATAPETAGVARVRTAGDGRWLSAGNAQRALGTRNGALLLLAPAGQGRIALLADASPLQNRLLDEADNAALALALGGEGPLAFVESVHGYGPARGLGALPARFGWALIGLALAALCFGLARGRRLGPPEPEQRDLAPPRRAYVDSLAATMAKGKQRDDAVAPVREEARRRLAKRAGLGPGSDDEAWIAAGRAAGLDSEATRALLGPARDDVTVVATGRALAGLARKGNDAGAP